MDFKILEPLIGESFLAIFPHGWIGRPGDSVYWLEEITTEKGYITLKLKNNLNIKMCESSQTILIGNSYIFISTDISIMHDNDSLFFEHGVISFIREEIEYESKIVEIHQSISDFINTPNYQKPF